MTKSIFHSLLSLAIWCAAAPAAVAQSYPAKPVKLVVTSGAGSSPDFQARVFSAKLAESWGQSLVIENAAGAAGNIGAERVAKSAPDGYTLVFASAGPLQFNMHLYSKLGYDIVRDFEPIMQVSRVANVLTVHPSVPASSVRELIAFARAHPGKLRYGSPGSGSSPHLAAELFKRMTGVDMLHIPYKSSAQMATDLVAGQFELTFQNAPVVLPYIKSGKLRALAVTTADRMPFAPELPALAESGLPGFDMAGGSGLLAPKGTPSAIIAKVYADMAKIMALPAVREQFAANGVAVVASAPDEFASALKRDIPRWAPIIKASGAKVD